MIEGACLCGAVRFEIDRAAGPFELCHCKRCRKSSGSAYLAGLWVNVADFRFVSGRDRISTFELPVRERPPGYRRSFCTSCGCLVPDPEPCGTRIEVPAGLFEGDPGMRPERHLFVDERSPWTIIADGLPQLDRRAVREMRERAAPGQGSPK